MFCECFCQTCIVFIYFICKLGCIKEISQSILRGSHSNHSSMNILYIDSLLEGYNIMHNAEAIVHQFICVFSSPAYIQQMSSSLCCSMMQFPDAVGAQSSISFYFLCVGHKSILCSYTAVHVRKVSVDSRQQLTAVLKLI